MITNTELQDLGNQFPNHIISFSQNVDKLYFKTKNKVVLEISILRDSVLRFRYGTSGQLRPDFSYAISKNSVKGYNHLEVSEDVDNYVITTSKLVCKIEKSSLQKKIYDTEGQLLNEDELGFHFEEFYKKGGNIVKMSKWTQDKEAFYGMGDKPMHSNLRGKRIQNWPTDEYAFTKDKDPIYKAVPFYIGLHHQQAYGVFFDNSFRTFFDFCQERHNITSFWAQGGEMNYYFIYGPKMENVLSSYTDLTGHAELPPMWALGYHQCKWSYYPESRFKEVAHKFRELKIPCDAIYLDIDYMDGFRCFTWNKEYFPDPKKMVKELADVGFKTVVIIDPGIKIDDEYAIYKEALEKDYFCKRADGPHMIGKVWPGECCFPDFTKPEVREWWSDLYKELIADIGVKGVWNDMNEPAVMEVPNKTFPEDVRHDYDGHPCSHRKAHNVYGTQMARATYKGVKKYGYPKRPFVITRSAFSGAQRYGTSWTGDNVASWEHLWIANVQVQRMNLSGMAFTGSDIGGFAEQPNSELFARWIQLGVFHPFCRTHSSGHHGDQEPWSFDDDVTNITRKFIELRYTLLPYLYTAFYDYSTEGLPIVKSLVFYDQDDPQTHFRTDEFIFGDKILVCPILEPNSKGRRMYFPRGEWYSFVDNNLLTGGKEMWVDADIETIPIYVKAGSVIPRYPVQQYVGELELEELKLDVYYKNGEEKSHIFEDAQDGYDYKKGRYSYRSFKTRGKKDELILSQHKQGKFQTEYTHFIINLIGLPFDISEVEIDNVKISLDELNFNETKTSFKVTKEFSEIHIKS